MKLLLPQLSPRLSKKVLAKSKFYGKNTPSKNKKAAKFGKPLYTQVLSKNIGNILKIKENFSELSNKKIEKINKSIFGKTDKPKPRINMMTRGPSHKQIIIPISVDHQGLIVTSNRVTSPLEISIVSNYVKNYNNIDPNNIQDTCLP